MPYGRIPDDEDDQLHSAENKAPIMGSNPAASSYVDSGFCGHLYLDANVLVSSNKWSLKPEWRQLDLNQR